MVKRAEKRRSERFGEYVRRIRTEKRLSLADVSKQSALCGMQISSSYINRIERNPKLKPTTHSLKALALGLGLPVEEVLTRAIRTLTPDEADELSLMSRYRKLSPERRSDVWDLIEFWHSLDSKK
jgi:HTH-type transcriptional regulator, competence development regulator